MTARRTTAGSRVSVFRVLPIGLLLAGLAVVLAQGSVLTLLAPLQDRHDLPTWGLGLIGGAAWVSACTAQLLLPRFVDRGHGRIVVSAGITSGLAGCLLFALGDNLWEFVGGRLLVGIAVGAIYPTLRAAAGGGDPARTAERLGTVSAVQVSGYVLGPLLAVALLPLGGPHLPFAVCALLMLLVLPLARSASSAPSVADPDKTGLLRISGVRAGLFLSTSFFIGAGMTEAVWSRFLTDAGASTTFIGVSFAVAFLPIVLLSTTGGRFGDRFGHRRSSFVTISGWALLTLLFTFLRVPELIMTVALFQSVLEAVALPTAAAVVAHSAPKGRAAAAQGLIGAIGAGVAAVTAFLSGALYDVGGPALCFGTCSALQAVSLTAAAVNGHLERRTAAGSAVKPSPTRRLAGVHVRVLDSPEDPLREAPGGTS